LYGCKADCYFEQDPHLSPSQALNCSWTALQECLRHLHGDTKASIDGMGLRLGLGMKPSSNTSEVFSLKKKRMMAATQVHY
jgi:hypothetical protein